MKLRKCHNKQDIVDFVLENTCSRYSKMFTEYQVEDMLYVDTYEGTFLENIKNFRNEPESYPVNVLLSERLFDYQHSLISNGITFIYEN